MTSSTARTSRFGRVAHLDRRGMATIAVIAAIVVLGPLIVPGDPLTQDLDATLQSPSWSHPLGTDQYGRDLAARLAHAVWRTLGMSLTVMIVAATIGLALGLASAALPGPGRWLVDRTVDVALGLPALLVALVIVGALGPGQRNLVIALIAGVWPWYARLSRDHARQIAVQPFIEAARVGGSRAVELGRATSRPTSSGAFWWWPRSTSGTP